MAKKKGRHEGGGGGGHDGGGTLRWLLTYADMITLLMAFFIMLYAMSVVNLGKFDQLALSVRSGFGGVIKGTKGRTLVSIGSKMSITRGIGPDSSDSDGDESKKFKAFQQSMATFLGSRGLKQFARMQRDERGLVLSFGSDKLLFNRGSAELKAVAPAVLHQLAAMLRQRHLSNPVRVEGHTCDIPIHTAQFPSNWELSTARATNVVRYLIAQEGFPPERVSAAGYADSRPLVPNDTEARRAMNRRVDIILLSEQETRKEPKGGSPKLQEEELPKLTSLFGKGR